MESVSCKYATQRYFQSKPRTIQRLDPIDSLFDTGDPAFKKPLFQNKSKYNDTSPVLVVSVSYNLYKYETLQKFQSGPQWFLIE